MIIPKTCPRCGKKPKFRWHICREATMEYIDSQINDEVQAEIKKADENFKKYGHIFPK